MNPLHRLRYALGIAAAAAMLAGCTGKVGGITLPPGVTPDDIPGHHTFDYTGGEQKFTVPARVTHIKITAHGGDGGGESGGYGGRLIAVVPVTPGEKLFVFVGGAGSQDKAGFKGGGHGSSDGGNPACDRCRGIGGGGASDVRQHGAELADRILVAGGGGGEGGRGSGGVDIAGNGGKGGGRIAGPGRAGTGSGSGLGGLGGTQQAGGTGGRQSECGDSGDDGNLGIGGAGGSAKHIDAKSIGGGGGGAGGGYFGGGGAGAGCASDGASGGGGGGGSSYIELRANHVHGWKGWKETRRAGLIVFDWYPNAR
jgi:hypothetical protein